MKLYLDTAPLIYTIEEVAPWAALVLAKISVPGIQVVTSDLAFLECRVRPLRLAQEEVIRSFDRFFEEGLSEVIPLSHEIMLKAAELRATHIWLRTPDAIHLAAALAAGCDAFLTNDKRLSRCTEIPVETLQ
jgi:predicted nucleic acid-binding protein